MEHYVVANTNKVQGEIVIKGTKTRLGWGEVKDLCRGGLTVAELRRNQHLHYLIHQGYLKLTECAEVNA